MPIAPVSPGDYDFLCRLLRERLGQDLGPEKEYLAESRLGALCHDKNLPGLGELFNQVRQAPFSPLVEDVLESMAIQETSFFRGQNTFHTLKTVLLPEMLAHSNRGLNIWSACCSTGQEPYSLALLIREHFPLAHKVRILATDFSPQALKRGQAARYSRMETVRGLPMELRQRYFTEFQDGNFLLHDVIREMVEFKKLNLLDSFAGLGGPFDLVLLRNVLIYMPLEVARDALDRVRRAIKDTGCLILGDSETILGKSDQFQINERGLNYFRPKLSKPESSAVEKP
ncbi:MAG: protein-glutamate O-methyltransferase CheR [Gemmataceae bacterium]|nr:protein-glutamate O-methyltransferase CheR [Gemmataceae bacterium]